MLAQKWQQGGTAKLNIYIVKCFADVDSDTTFIMYQQESRQQRNGTPIIYRLLCCWYMMKVVSESTSAKHFLM